jgi:hypothetical protein
MDQLNGAYILWRWSFEPKRTPKAVLNGAYTFWRWCIYPKIYILEMDF